MSLSQPADPPAVPQPKALSWEVLRPNEDVDTIQLSIDESNIVRIPITPLNSTLT